jgi:hypothetical protein
MMAKGKQVNVTKTAIARELLGCNWAIAQELSKTTTEIIEYSLKSR